MERKYEPGQCFREMLSVLSCEKEYHQHCYSLPRRNLPWILAVPSSDCWYFWGSQRTKGDRHSSWEKGDKEMRPARRKESLPQIHSPLGTFRLNPCMVCVFIPSFHFFSNPVQLGSFCLLTTQGFNGRSPNSVWPWIQLHPQKYIFAPSFSLLFAR